MATLWTSNNAVALFPSWGDDGWIYLSTGSSDPTRVIRVPEVGGAPEVLFEASSGVVVGPSPIAGGRAVLWAQTTANTADALITVLDLESRDTTILASGFSPRWSATGHVLYWQDGGSVWAVPFDPARLEATGPAAPVLEGVRIFRGIAHYAVSSSGTLVYAASASAAGGGGGFAFLLVSPDGTTERLPLEPSDHWDAQLSPDGTRLAYTRDSDVWIYDLDRGSNDSLTAGGTGRSSSRPPALGTCSRFRRRAARLRGCSTPTGRRLRRRSLPTDVGSPTRARAAAMRNSTYAAGLISPGRYASRREMTRWYSLAHPNGLRLGRRSTTTRGTRSSPPAWICRTVSGWSRPTKPIFGSMVLSRTCIRTDAC